MTTYWILVNKNFDRGAYVPSYEILTAEPPEGTKKEALPPGHYLDLFKCSLSKDGTFIVANLYRVTNNDGVISEVPTEKIFIKRG